MPLSSGTRLGPYEIIAPVGAGGMGEVYRANDKRLDRTVAIKILPSHLSSNSDFKQRFEREARAISKLSHPNICGLYDVGSQDGVEFLVMEFLEGETLAQRLSKGPLPIDLALRYAVQTADALDKAHRHGIVHRDLKPGNIMLTKSGVKLLDFGLAKLQRAPVSESTNVSILATEARDITAQGTILGTVQYMAPEQLEGKEADARTDIFALGSVLYEMATGKKAFSGSSQASLISAILKDEPLPISKVQPLSPAALDRVVKMCLAKDPDERWQNAHDLMKELMWIAEGSSQANATTTAVASTRNFLPWIFASVFLLTAIAAWITHLIYKSAPQELMELSISPPADNELVYAPAISPDGSRVAFLATDKNGKTNLWVRSMRVSTPEEIPGTEGAIHPFWSGDSRFIGFFAKGKLMKVDPSGGHPQALCDFSDERGGAWNGNGVILFAPNPGDGIYRISSDGGSPTRVTSLDPSREETSHRFPHFLPDGNHFLFWVKAQKAETGIYIGSLESHEKSFLLSSERSGIFSSGYLLFQRSGMLLAQPFDTSQLKLSGEAVSLSGNVWYEPQMFGTRGISVSNNNILTFREASNLSQLLWFDRKGNQQGALGSPEEYAQAPHFSPDGKKFAIQVIDGGAAHVWVYQSSGEGGTRLTFSSGWDTVPRWSPDGTRIVFASSRSGPYQLYMRDAAGAGNEEQVFKSPTGNWCMSDDWSADGDSIIFSENDAKTKYDLWILKLKERKAFPFLVTDANESSGKFSPDGKWIAYASDESGRPEVYVQPFYGQKGGKWQISTKGGYTPKWSRDGKELFYLSLENQIMSSMVLLEPTFNAAPPQPLFSIHPFAIPRIAPWFEAFEPAPDGQRFIVHSGLTSSLPNIAVVVNWQLLLRKNN